MTTVPHTIGGLEQATEGTIRFDDRDVTRLAPGGPMDTSRLERVTGES